MSPPPIMIKLNHVSYISIAITRVSKYVLLVTRSKPKPFIFFVIRDNEVRDNEVLELS